MPTERTDLIPRLRAGVSQHGVTPAFAERVLSRLPAASIAEHLERIAGDPPALRALGERAYVHPNGFVKLPLLREAHGFAVRLHFWTGRDPSEENAHTHRWAFSSRVVFGALDSELLEPVPGGALHAFRYGREGAEATLAAEGRCGVTVRVTQRHHAGSAYHLPPEQLHRIVMRDPRPTLTLMVQSAPFTATNLMLSATPTPEVRPPPLGTRRTRRALDEILVRLREAA